MRITLTGYVNKEVLYRGKDGTRKWERVGHTYLLYVVLIRLVSDAALVLNMV